jgi:hypothetical protein
MKAGRFLTAAMIVFALVVVPMAAYVGGYYWLAVATYVGFEGPRNDERFVDRVYASQWQADIFKPAARAESWLTSSEVGAFCFDDLADDGTYQ